MQQQVHTKEVGSNVIDDDQGAGQQEPHEPVKDIAHKETGRDEHHQQYHMSPGILRKLVGVHALLQPQDKGDKACRADRGVRILGSTYSIWETMLTRSGDMAGYKPKSISNQKLPQLELKLANLLCAKSSRDED